MNIRQNLTGLLEQIPDYIKLVAISKTKPVKDIMEAYDTGHRIFGENKVQELVAKQPLLPDDIQWHFVGHLQSNKVKYIAPFVHLIHGVDSLKLLKEIHKQGVKNDRTIDCLLQFRIAEEETKFGLTFLDAENILLDESFPTLQNVRIIGVMGMATFTSDESKFRREFKQLANYYHKLKAGHFQNDDHFREISMGMSGDYQAAIEEGSTMIRIGTLIFGERNKR